VKHPLVSSAHTPQHALVIGAGIAGLLTARVLLDHFAAVTVVGRCPPPDARPPGHVLAVPGFRALERLFPGLGAELALTGAPSIDWTADCPALLPQGWAARWRSGLVTRAISGEGLAAIVRRRLAEYGGDRLTLRDNVRAVGLLWDGDRVCGARLARDAGPNATALTAAADFVVDAGGRGSQAGAWLAQAGYDTPPETHIGVPAAYALGMFRRPANADTAWRALLVVPAPGRAGLLLHPLENGRWAVTIALPPGVSAPADFDALLALARALPTPAVYEALCAAEALHPPRAWAHPGSRAVDYHRLARWPQGLAVTGDAVCALDPAYGHSLTAVALAALACDAVLGEQRRAFPDGALDGLGQRLQKAQAAALKAPVRAAAAFEAWRAGEAGAVAGRCADALLAAAASRPAAYGALLESFTLTRSPAALLRPSAALRALRPAPPPLTAAGPFPPAPDPGAGRSTQELAVLS
jgi:flavin-dependent dehydrogenase